MVRAIVHVAEVEVKSFVDSKRSHTESAMNPNEKAAVDAIATAIEEQTAALRLVGSTPPPPPPPPPPPTYALSVSPSQEREGAAFTFTLTTTGVAVGAQVPYTITGVSIEDLVQVPLTGLMTIQADGKASISVRTAVDQAIEGPETMTMAVGPASVSAVILDATQPPPPPPPPPPRGGESWSRC
jgi:hypothetical protein